MTNFLYLNYIESTIDTDNIDNSIDDLEDIFENNKITDYQIKEYNQFMLKLEDNNSNLF